MPGAIGRVRKNLYINRHIGNSKREVHSAFFKEMEELVKKRGLGLGMAWVRTRKRKVREIKNHCCEKQTKDGEHTRGFTPLTGATGGLWLRRALAQKKKNLG